MSLESFFHHYSLEFAFKQDYDFDEDYIAFVERKKEAYQASEAFAINYKPFSEYDIFNASIDIKRLVPDLFSALLEIAEKNLNTPEAVLMQSMHSGSSEYLRVRDILALK